MKLDLTFLKYQQWLALHHKPIELLVPLSGSLFQTIQALRQSANHLFIALFRKPFWLLHVYFFLQISMKKCSFDIQVLKI
jgi:hypothetical protein